MRKAFTLLELVFVIVLIGILASVIIPRMNTDRLGEAAHQVVSHIRHTQHLAMSDDSYDASDVEWFRERWTLRFKEDLVYTSTLPPSGTYEDEWSYSVFSDKSHDNNPNKSELAKNPLNSAQYLSGGYNNTLHVEDQESMSSLRLGSSYGVKDVSFSGGCRSNILYIYFDHLGRPFNSVVKDKPYETASSGYHKLLTSACNISLCEGTCTGTSSSSEVIIKIEPETGYSCVLDISGNCLSN
jgi:prepilin-type N-terminal cleavage/methylation domain-containing protein